MTTQSFNEMHSVGEVLRGKAVGHCQTLRQMLKQVLKRLLGRDAVETLPTKIEEIDLRFLTMIQMGDTYNGDDNPVGGTAYKAVLYGNQIAWQQERFYWEGSCEQRWSEGNELYRAMYYVAQLYLKIQQIGFAMYHGHTLKKDAEVLYVSESDFRDLAEHPQYKEMVEDFGLELEETGKPHRFKVVVRKRRPDLLMG